MSTFAARKLLWANRVPLPSLDLNFLTGALDSRITFTRAAGAATYFDSAGVVQNAGTNVARFDYDPATLAPRGLLIEEARTNLHFPSGTVATLFSATASTLTASSGTAPDGTNTMVKLAENNASAVHFGSKNVTVTGSAQYTFSIFAKAVENHFLQLIYDSGANGVQCNFDLSLGTAGTLGLHGSGGTAGSATITPVGNGIYRCSVSGIAGSSTTGRCGVILVTSLGAGYAQSYLGTTGNGVLIWGSQLELGTFPTSYIPTVGSAATRALDLATMPTDTWFNAVAMSVAAEAVIPYGVNTFDGLYALNDGTANNRLQQAIGGSMAAVSTVSSGGVNSVAVPETAIVTLGPIIKFGSSLQTGQFMSCLNGAPPYVNGASIVMPAGINIVNLGNLIGTSLLNGYLRRLRYWPQALRAGQLQRVTT